MGGPSFSFKGVRCGPDDTDESGVCMWEGWQTSSSAPRAQPLLPPALVSREEDTAADPPHSSTELQSTPGLAGAAEGAEGVTPAPTSLPTASQWVFQGPISRSQSKQSSSEQVPLGLQGEATSSSIVQGDAPPAALSIMAALGWSPQHHQRAPTAPQIHTEAAATRCKKRWTEDGEGEGQPQIDLQRTRSGDVRFGHVTAWSNSNPGDRSNRQSQLSVASSACDSSERSSTPLHVMQLLTSLRVSTINGGEFLEESTAHAWRASLGHVLLQGGGAGRAGAGSGSCATPVAAAIMQPPPRSAAGPAAGTTCGGAAAPRPRLSETQQGEAGCVKRSLGKSASLHYSDAPQSHGRVKVRAQCALCTVQSIALTFECI